MPQLTIVPPMKPMLVALFGFLIWVGCSSAQANSDRRETSQPSVDGPTTASIRETPISFGTHGLVLHGVFTSPSSHFGTHPGVLLIQGSGPTNGDGNPPGIKIDLLKQIADRLAAKGVASLRFDKRSTRTYQANWPSNPAQLSHFFSWQNFVSDARDAFVALKSSPGVDPTKTSILGHSEGGIIALFMANDSRPRSLILMATPARSLADILRAETVAMMKRQNLTSAQEMYFIKEFSRTVTAIEKTGVVPSDVPQGLKALFPPSAGNFLEEVLPLVPASLIRHYRNPVFVLNGLKDQQIDPELDAKTLYKDLRARGNESVQKLELFPGLSHNFKLVTSSNELGFEGPVPEPVLDAIAKWLLRI